MGLLVKRIGANSVLSRVIDTIPSYQALNGTVTISSTDTTVLNYAGTTDWLAIFDLPDAPPQLTPNPFAVVQSGAQFPHSKIWIYVPTATPVLARVIGIATAGANAFTLQLDRAMPSVNGAACNYVTGNLLGYSWNNDGAAAGTFNGVVMNEGNTGGVPQLAPVNNRTKFQDVAIVNATSTSVLVEEIS